MKWHKRLEFPVQSWKYIIRGKNGFYKTLWLGSNHKLKKKKKPRGTWEKVW